MKYLLIIASLFIAGFAYGQTVSVVAETGEFVGVPTAARIDVIEAGTSIGLASNRVFVGQSTGKALGVAVSGDLSVATNGAFTIADEAVTLAKMADMATLSVIGRSTEDAGVPEVLTAATDHFVLRRSGSALGFGLLVDANIDAAAAIAHTKLSGVAAAPAVVGSVDGTTNTVTITANDGAGATLAAKRLMRVWVSETSGGSPSTNNIESVTLSGGAAIQTITTADYVYLTADTGIASAEVIGTAAGTNYMNVADGGYVTSAAVVFE